jgi:hypothetical protein
MMRPHDYFLPGTMMSDVRVSFVSWLPWYTKVHYDADADPLPCSLERRWSRGDSESLVIDEVG